MRNSKKKLGILIFLLVFMIFFIGKYEKIVADTKNQIIVEAKDLPSKGIFCKERDGVWHPSKEKINDFIVKNQGPDKVILRRINFDQVKLLNKKGNEIKENHKEHSKLMNNTFISLYNNGKKIYEGPLKDALKKSGIPLNNIPLDSNSKKLFQIKFNMSKDADNDLQGLREEFGLAVTCEKALNNNINNENLKNLNSNNSILEKINSSVPKTGQVIGTTFLIVLGILLFLLGIGAIKFPKKDGEKGV